MAGPQLLASPGVDRARPVRGRLVAALAVLALTASCLAGLALGPSDAAPVAGPLAGRGAGADGGTGAGASREEAAPGPSATLERVGALSVLLGARSAALLAGDRAGWLGPVVAGSGYAARQGEVFERLSALPVASWRWEYLGVGAALHPARLADLAGGSAPGGTGPGQNERQDAGQGSGQDAGRPWVAHVALVYDLAGAGGAVRRDQYLTLAREGGRWLVADDGDGPTAKDLWDLGPVSVARGVRSLVLGVGVDAYPALVDAASAAVDAAWGRGWPRSTVVEVPATQDQMAALLGRADPAGLDRVAAVTTGETVGGGTTTTGDRVVVNPEGFARLVAEGRQVVLTHELTHVATRHGATATVPTWLSEGYAEWVGYRGSGLSDADLAQPLVEAVRSRAADGSGGPDPLDHLPDEQGFDPAQGDVPVAYAGSWLAVDLIARRYGDDAVTELYRDVADAAPADPLRSADPLAVRPGGPDARLDRALRARLGVDGTALVAQWRQRAETLARQGS